MGLFLSDLRVLLPDFLLDTAGKWGLYFVLIVRHWKSMNKPDHKITNYCASFIDLLGQENALKGQGLAVYEGDKNYESFLQSVDDSVGVIRELHNKAELFVGKSKIPLEEYGLSEKDKKIYEEISKGGHKKQRWSDGLVLFSSLEEEGIPCPLNAIFEIVIFSGVLCFIGLSEKRPIRGGIDISWGTELHENELYGAIVANSYRLESKVAQSPRIVLHQRVIDYLNTYLDKPANTNNKIELYNRSMAALVRDMTVIDHDGNHIIDYLNGVFTKSVTSSRHIKMYTEAYRFICEQCELHRNSRNTSLALRYIWLKGYFHGHRELHT